MTWEAQEQPFVGTSNDHIDGLFINGDGVLVAWGGYQRSTDYSLEVGTVFWRTANGVTWQDSRLGEPGGWRYMRDVVSGPNGFVAVSDEAGWPGAWWSEDGITWARSSIDPEPASIESDAMIAVASGPAGYLAVGGVGGEESRLAGWFSRSGREWTRLDLDIGGGWFEDVVASADGGFVAVGAEYVRGGAVEQIWRVSPDGQTWRSARSLDDTAGAAEDAPDEVFAFAGGYAAFGMSAKAGEDISCKGCQFDPDRQRVYTSTDGITWDRQRMTGVGRWAPSPPWYGVVEPYRDGLVAVGSDSDNNYQLWTSADGVRWERVGGPLGSPMNRTYFDMLISGDRIVLAGTTYEGGLVTIGTSGP